MFFRSSYSLEKTVICVITENFSVRRICDPPILRGCRKRRNIKRAAPIIDPDAVPYVSHNLHRMRRQILRCTINRLSVDIPRNTVTLPIECVFVKILRSVESKIEIKLVTAHPVRIIIEIGRAHV